MDNLIAILTLCGLILTVIKYEFDMQRMMSDKNQEAAQERWQKELNTTDAKESIRWSWDQNFWRFLVLGLSILSAISVVFR